MAMPRGVRPSPRVMGGHIGGLSGVASGGDQCSDHRNGEFGPVWLRPNSDNLSTRLPQPPTALLSFGFSENQGRPRAGFIRTVLILLTWRSPTSYRPTPSRALWVLFTLRRAINTGGMCVDEDSSYSSTLSDDGVSATPAQLRLKTLSAHCASIAGGNSFTGRSRSRSKMSEGGKVMCLCGRHPRLAERHCILPNMLEELLVALTCFAPQQ
ncbi:hypothetical protein FB451DRAFT_1190287 [Mycena latifolia]|nr:hypothetical protein FB451DRAFT_1190287 [Mycena latifolia]